MPVETLRFGSVDDPETALTSIRALDLGPDGRIYTLHPRENLVRIHGPDGAPLRAFGGEGEGPGEFVSPIALDIFGEEVWVWDDRSLRVTRFDLEGELIGVETHRPAAFEHVYLRPARPDVVLPDLTFLGSYSINTVRGAEERTENPLLRLGVEGDILDTVFVRPLEGGYLWLELGMGDPTVTSHPYPWDPIFAVAARRMEVIVAERDVHPDAPEFRVTRLTIEGDTLWSRTYPYDPVPPDMALIETRVEFFATAVERAGWTTRRHAEEVFRGGIRIPEHIPPLTRVIAGHDGSIWLELADNDETANSWLILAEDGEPYGRVVLPGRFYIRHATLEGVLGMELDELDVPYVVGYDLTLEAGP
ncbi:MAG: hypothetical protein R3195_13285 [Gemmatimonadota bacterium]|nr:hypothetical protein [Gemmatimonadota bacterium]